MESSVALAPQKKGLLRRASRFLWSVRKRIMPNSETVIPFDRDMKIKVRPIDRLGRRVLLDGYSDRDLARLLNAYLKAGMTFLDIGAHFGQFTLMAAKRVGAEGAVHAFEPTKHTFSQLKENIVLNGFENVRLNNVALYEKEDQLEFHVCNKKGMSEFNSIGRTLRPESAETEIVDALPLDRYIADNKIECVDLMKVDVEGAERSVFRGAAELLQSEDAPPISIEFNETTCANMGYSTAELRDQVKAFGYTLYRFDAETLEIEEEPDRDHYPEVANLLAVKRLDMFQKNLGSDA